MKNLFAVIFTCLLINSYGQISLIGKWRRINPGAKEVISPNIQAQIGDLTLNPDSTFFIKGDSMTKLSAIPGWYSGGEYSGTWELIDRHHLNLFPTPRQDRLFLPYLIVSLTNEKLVLRSALNNKKSKFIYLTYRRI
jgi:hypothetical protein